GEIPLFEKRSRQKKISDRRQLWIIAGALFIRIRENRSVLRRFLRCIWRPFGTAVLADAQGGWRKAGWPSSTEFGQRSGKQTPLRPHPRETPSPRSDSRRFRSS